MKIKLIAVAVTSMLAATVANAAEVYNKDGNKLDMYGRVKAMHYFSDNKGVDGDQTYVRLGFKGETQIADQLVGYGRWEYQFQGNRVEGDTSGDKTRLAYAGLKFGEYGSLDYGRNFGVNYDIGAWTDMLPEFGNDTTTQTDIFMTGRTTGVATYRNNDFFGLVDGLNFALQYQGREEGNRTVAKQHGDGWGMSSSYTYEGFAVGASYAKSDRTDAQVVSSARGENAEIWNVGLKYDDNNVYLAALYAETRNMTTYGSSIANKAQNFEVVAQYQFDFGLRPSIAYLQSKGKDLNGGWGDEDLMKYIDIGATYYFNKNMSAFVDYKINQLDSNRFTRAHGLNTDDVVALGLMYQF
ncbi:porin OmpC [Entomohabitans teleogrylli]|uniref:porin OmpC n=1 Tax=Entomohabitans teleogrylli TaxID=1384589 RepID=UPI00073DAC0F|nr:porin OmpC [Entomohabitans teleogrylli]